MWLILEFENMLDIHIVATEMRSFLPEKRYYKYIRYIAKQTYIKCINVLKFITDRLSAHLIVQ